MAAGPWFTVQDSDTATFADFGQVWWSDGSADGRAHLQLSLELLPADPVPDLALVDGSDPS